MASPWSSPVQSISEIDHLIRTAIVEKFTLEAVYDGRLRILCPQMLGRNREGRLRILCLQIGGESVSGLQRQVDSSDWRCLALEKFSTARRATVEWRTAEDSLRRPKCIEQIELEVDQPERDPQKGH